MRGTRWLALIVGVASAITVAGGAALAHRQGTLDARDTAGPLDLSGAEAIHKRSPETGRRFFDLTLAAYEPWGPSEVAGPHQFVAFEVDLTGNRRPNRCVVIKGRAMEPGGLDLEAKVYRGCVYMDDKLLLTTQMITRVDEHSVTVRVPRRVILPRWADTYRWRAVSAYEAPGHNECPAPEPHGDGGYGVCTDLTRWVKHR